MRGKITLLNRLQKKDSVTNLDIWYKTVINDCEYKKERITDMNGTTVAMGTQFTILIPFTGKYLPYREWKKLDDKTGYYTLSTKDVIVLGDVEGDVNPSNIISIKNDYSPDSCDIQSIEQVEQRFSANYEFRVGGI